MSINTLQDWFLSKLDYFGKLDGLWEENLNFFKFAKSNNTAVECYWESKVSQTSQNFGFLLQNKQIFPKFLSFFEFDKGSKFAVECVSNRKL